MSPVVRTAWALLNLRSLAMLVIACWMLAQVPAGPAIYEPLTSGALAGALGLLATHIARVLAVGVWRVLPNGSRTVAQAIACIVVALSLLVGTLLRFAAPDLLADIPLGSVLAVFIHLTLFGFLLLLGIGRQLPRFFSLLYLIACAVSLSITTVTFRDTPSFWMGGTALCTGAWLYASIAGFRPPNYSRRRFAWDVGVETLLARAGRKALPHQSPALTLLRSGRTGSVSVFIAILVVVIMAVMQHTTMGRLPMVPFMTFLAAPMIGVAIFACFHAARFAPAAKLLWLRHGGSRAELFRLVERTAMRDACLLGLVTCAAVTGLALLRGAITPADALKLLVPCVGIPLTLGYVGLLLSAVHRTWGKIVVLAVGVFCVDQAPSWLLTAAGASQHGIADVESPALAPAIRLALALLTIFAIRYVAAARWRRVDWSYYRTARS